LAQPLAQGLLFGSGLSAAGEGAQARGEHRGARQRDLGDGKLDGKLAAVGAHRGQLQMLPQHGSLAGCQVAVQPGLMRLAQRRGDDEPGQWLAHRLVAVAPKTRSAAGLNSTTRPWWSMVIQQSSADSKIADLRASRAIAPACQTQRRGPVNTALLLLVLVGGEGAVKLPVRRSVWRNREDTDA
jgi:hypothetical protein